MYRLFIIIFFLLHTLEASSQQFKRHRSHDFKVFDKEWGISVGNAVYFGDLNSFYDYLSPNFSVGIFYKKYFNPYVGYRLQGNYIFLSGNDKLSSNQVQQRRNLNFSSNVIEAFAGLEVNFFRYTPEGYFSRYTPFLSFGLGGIYFDTYTSYNNQRVRLSNILTEASGDYIPLTIVIPLGFGVKFNVNRNFNFEIELLHRISFSDFIDDVSGSYIGTGNSGDAIAEALQDRSGENGSSLIGVENRQRGTSTIFDQYQTINIKLSFNIYKYTCP